MRCCIIYSTAIIVYIWGQRARKIAENRAKNSKNQQLKNAFFTHKNTPQPAWLRGFFHGDPGGIRTPDPRLRRPLLYPTELLNHINLERAMGIEPTTSAWKAEVLPLNYTRANGRSGRIRTCDTLLPRQVRYQTALHPEYKRYYTI